MVTRVWIAFAFAAIALAVLAARPLPTPGPLSRDFEAYWAAGSAWNAGADPYGRAIWAAERRVGGVDASREELLPFVGPPATLLAWSVAARLPYESAARVWIAILAISLLALVAGVLRGCGKRTAAAFLAALALAVAFAPISSDLALGQLALPSFLGAVLLCVWADRSPALATLGGCLALAQPNAALGLASRIGRNRATLAMALAALVTYLLGAIANGWAWPLRYARVAAAHGAAERFAAIQFSPASLAYGFGATPRASEAIGVAVAVLAIGAAIALALRVGDPFARFAAFSALAPFVAGFFHEHDLLVAYAAALWCALRARGAARVVALAGTLLVAIDWLGLAQRPTGIAQSVLLAAAAFAAFVALGNGLALRQSFAIAATVAVVFAGAASLAAHFPAPIWPDALGPFHAPASAGAATVWGDEQRASGLLAAVPAWALLRFFSLLGCALLAYAIAVCGETKYPRRARYRTA